MGPIYQLYLYLLPNVNLRFVKKLKRILSVNYAMLLYVLTIFIKRVCFLYNNKNTIENNDNHIIVYILWVNIPFG